MKVALMQPYFFPYIGYFQLINEVDEFVIFDNAQYIRRSWITRNRLLNAHKESTFINVPVCKEAMGTKIKDIRINNDIQWQNKIFQQLLYYKNAPYYQYVKDFLSDCFTVNDSDYVSQFNTRSLKMICDLLKIDTKITVLSEKFPAIDTADEADEWGIKVSKALNASTYINAIGGKEFYNPEKYLNNGIDIQFVEPVLLAYKQFKPLFVPGLSIIDVMMFNEIEKIREMLQLYLLVN